MTDRLNILIVGGYGTFGGRIVELLENESRLALIVTGRSARKASAFCDARLSAKAELVPAAFDRNGNLAAQIAALQPSILIDASGPFQSYGSDRYRVIEACIAQGVNYLDLADGSDFVAGVRAYDSAARAAGVYVLSGVSSFPVLTAAVVRHLSSDLARVDAIRGGIAPSPYAGVGENVIRAIAGYAGQPVALKRDGKTRIGYAFTEHTRCTIAPPGRLPLQNTMFSLVDVPDLHALAELWPDAGTIWMGAGPVPEILHRALSALAWLVRFRLLPSLSGLAPLMQFATNHLRWGEHRGGMFVDVEGVDRSEASIKRSWHLLAEGDDGPLIPSMAVEALVRNALKGRVPSAGARAAVKELELGDYEKLFAERTIYTGVWADRPSNTTPLYARILGTSWETLPIEIRNMHDIGGATSVVGHASVERGDNPLARLAAFILRFPRAAVDTPVSVKFEVSDETETWTRRFANDVFSSCQFAGHGRSAGLLCERFGPLSFAMALIPEKERLSLVLRRWSAFGVPLPMWLCPRSDSFEAAENGRFRFHVEIGHPLCGLIVRYKGWLEPDQPLLTQAKAG
jgi:Domain of unknown function (DUF4166)/Saccharopine dehydrogenase NADP binding domain